MECFNTCWGSNSEIRAQLNYWIKIYLYLYNRVSSFKRSRLVSFKAAGLVSFDCAKFYIMFNMNFTKDLVLCEIIERHKGKTIMVVKNVYCRIIIQNDSYECRGVNEGVWNAYSDHFFASKFWLLAWSLCFSRVSVNLLTAVWQCVLAYFNHIW